MRSGGLLEWTHEQAPSPTRVRGGLRAHASRDTFPEGLQREPEGPTKGRHLLPPYDAVLGQMVVVRESGVERRVTAAEAFLLHLTKRGLEGDGAAARLTMAVTEKARSARPESGDRIPEASYWYWRCPAA